MIKIMKHLKKIKTSLRNHPVIELLLLSIVMLLIVNQMTLSNKLSRVVYVLESKGIKINNSCLILNNKISKQSKTYTGDSY